MVFDWGIGEREGMSMKFMFDNLWQNRKTTDMEIEIALLATEERGIQGTGTDFAIELICDGVEESKRVLVKFILDSAANIAVDSTLSTCIGEAYSILIPHKASKMAIELIPLLFRFGN